MTFHPMIDPLYLGAVLVCALGLVAFRLIRARDLPGVLAWSARGLMVILVCGVLLRPGVPALTQTLPAPQTDVFLIVDTTASSAAEDGPDGITRLSQIQTDVAALVGQLAGARFELITFSRGAAISVPLTSDTASLMTAIGILQTEVSGYAKGSSIGIAAELLRDQLRSANAATPDRARAAYYFGDGEQTAPTTPESFADSAQYLGGGSVFGYGTATGGQMIANAGRTADGNPGAYIVDQGTGVAALSRIDPANLGTIATGLGVPLDIRDNGADIEAGEIHGTTVSGDGELSRTGFTEFYWIPSIGLVGLLAVECGVLISALMVSGPGRFRS
ncbi:vWA domain-containing protein [Cryobacterium zhongshanensis]|uniref:VWA domain-containing protein n=1 Tax=Cryobacterium zhongshanensis TaxID=2928153 RepID=A0AA41UEN3_9MICO|nr:VWA domain-containing protein [Cryobacterium zhongshanensis]MCI4657623.1 VWA domain-containing protein [Cryobacterium zhongshanensis]